MTITVDKDGDKNEITWTKGTRGVDVGTYHARRIRTKKDAETDYVKWSQQTRNNHTGTIEIGTREAEETKDKEVTSISTPTIERINNKARADQADGAREQVQEQDKGTTDPGLSIRNRNEKGKGMSMKRKKRTGS